ncbi:MAG: pyrroloquinoline quinone biosynthesis protein B, partial [Euryarchaeota archaeon]|nr:pyrroloquinoline quinone biosynthesis protein B [Euryarchaeota archaeon]
ERRVDDPEIIFIHLNHTNPLYDESSPAYEEVISNGWEVGVQGQTFIL